MNWFNQIAGVEVFFIKIWAYFEHIKKSNHKFCKNRIADFPAPLGKGNFFVRNVKKSVLYQIFYGPVDLQMNLINI